MNDHAKVITDIMVGISIKDGDAVAIDACMRSLAACTSIAFHMDDQGNIDLHEALAEVLKIHIEKAQGKKRAQA